MIGSEAEGEPVEHVNIIDPKVKAESKDTGSETELYEIGNVDETVPEDDYAYISVRARYTPAVSVVMKHETKELSSDHGASSSDVPDATGNGNPGPEEGMSSKVTFVTDTQACDHIYENVSPQNDTL